VRRLCYRHAEEKPREKVELVGLNSESRGGEGERLRETENKGIRGSWRPSDPWITRQKFRGGLDRRENQAARDNRGRIWKNRRYE